MANLRDLLYDVPGPRGIAIDNVIIDMNGILVDYVNNVLDSRYSFKILGKRYKIGKRLERHFTKEDVAVSGPMQDSIRLLVDAGITRNDVDYMLQCIEDDGQIEKSSPKAFCVDSLKQMALTNKIYFIASRTGNSYKDETSMMKNLLANLENKYAFRPSDVIFNRDHSAIDECKINLFFKCDPRSTLELLDKGKRVIMFDSPQNTANFYDGRVLSDEAYNQKECMLMLLEDYKTKDKLVRTSGWNEIYCAYKGKGDKI